MSALSVLSRRQEIARTEADIAFLEEHIFTSLGRLERLRAQRERLEAEEDDRLDVEELAGAPVVVKGMDRE